MTFGCTIEVVAHPNEETETRYERRAQRRKRLWEAYQAEGRPEPEPGETIIPTPNSYRRFQRSFLLGQIRNAIEALPEKRRPIISRRGGTLILDYGIYQEEHDLRGFRITLTGYTVPSLVKHAEKLSTTYRSSLSAFERDAAGQVGLLLAELRHGLDSGAPNLAIVAAFKLGRAVERLEGVAPVQHRALSGARQAKRNRNNNSVRSEAAEPERERRRQAVYAAMEQQKRNRERLSFRRAIKAAATQCQCSVESIKDAEPVNNWTARK